MSAAEIVALFGAAGAVLLSAWGLTNQVNKASFNRLEKQLDRLQEVTNKQDETIGNLRQDNELLQSHFIEQSMRLAQGQIDLAKAQIDLTALKRDHHMVETRLKLAEESNTKLYVRLEAAEMENKSLRHDLQTVQRALGAEQKSTEDLKKRVEELSRENGELRRQLGQLETKEFKN